MRSTCIADFLAQRDARAKQLGIAFTPELRDALRDKGVRHTPEKRAALRSIEERCAEAGVKPRKAHY